jgi:glycine/D-amino acid oxidase-like deaminating enzyme
MLDWLIIGGGVHGTHISRVLTQRGGVAPERLRVLDPHAEPMARWNACAHNTGMTFLRSPAAHNIDVQPADLHHFAEYEVKDARYTRPYHRPSTELFRQHCNAVIDRGQLRALRINGSARRLTCEDAAVRIETDHGELQARRVVLALGGGDAPSWPDWARRCGAARRSSIMSSTRTTPARRARSGNTSWSSAAGSRRRRRRSRWHGRDRARSRC